MITQIKRFSILQTGKLLAVLYGLLAIVLVPVFMIPMLASTEKKESFPFLIMLILYPLMGFIGGIIGAALYNLTSRITGGLEFSLDIVKDTRSEQAQNPIGTGIVPPPPSMS